MKNCRWRVRLQECDFENLVGPYKVSACAGLFVRQFFLYRWHASRTAHRFRRLISRIFLPEFGRTGVHRPIFRNKE
jgi:hypothetical protein